MNIPPKNKWKDLSISELFNVKTEIQNAYYDMRAANVSFAEQYAKFIQYADALLAEKYAEQEQKKEDENQGRRP